MSDGEQKKGNPRREEVSEEVAAMRKRTAEKREELKGIMKRFHEAIDHQEKRSKGKQ